MSVKIGGNELNLGVFLENIKNKFNLSDEEIAELFKTDEIVLPISIFNDRLGMLESSALYMKDKLKLSFTEIARLLKRDYKTIWTSYNQAKKKNAKK